MAELRNQFSERVRSFGVENRVLEVGDPTAKVVVVNRGGGPAPFLRPTASATRFSRLLTTRVRLKAQLSF